MSFVISYLLLQNRDSTNALYAFLLIQTAYITYILNTFPHVDEWFNSLEIVNEVIIILIIYTMKGYTTTSILKGNVQWMVGYITVALILATFLLNVAMMLSTITSKVRLTLRKKKAQKQRAKAHEKNKQNLRNEADKVRNELELLKKKREEKEKLKHRI